MTDNLQIARECADESWKISRGDDEMDATDAGDAELWMTARNAALAALNSAEGLVAALRDALPWIGVSAGDIYYAMIVEQVTEHARKALAEWGE